MQPPIKIGTVLQYRYRIIQILGQGGFGRTYLAEDQRRFNELCAIKELIFTAPGGSPGGKEQELFEREALALYQIEHPQVPKFRERFEQDQRLFLVEDYVAGQTYRTLLLERQSVHQTFTEAEVLHLMQSLLPVLEHIHNRGIIHRDISPENIILRANDSQPVLIDFGVVKELATKLQSPINTPITTVGKLGYTPTEQMQTGRAYPSSDLYALAVTAIVLLTGKEPHDLFDEHQLTWNWQQLVKVNPRFAEVLQRMLSHLPSARYQKAADVAQVLRSLDQPLVPDLSSVQTMAVGHRPDPLPTPDPSVAPKPNQIIPPSHTTSVLDSPWAVGAIISAVVIVAGLGSWTVVNFIRSQNKKPIPETSIQSFPSPVITPNLSSTPTNLPTSKPTNASVPPKIFSKRLNLGASNTAKITGNIQSNQITQYRFAGIVGQKLIVSVDPESGVLLTILDTNRQSIHNASEQITSYAGILPKSGQYTIQLTLGSSLAASDYSLNVSLENPVEVKPTPTLVSTPTGTLVPTPIPTSVPTPTIPSVSESPNQSTPVPPATPGSKQNNIDQTGIGTQESGGKKKEGVRR